MDALWQLGNLRAQNILQPIAAQGQQLLCRLIAFRVDTGSVQRVAALRHTQESGTLLKRFFPELRHLHQLTASCELSVLLPIMDNILCHRCVDPGNMGKQRPACGIQIYAYPVDAVLHHASQRGIHLLGRHIVLILADTDCLRVDFHQLRQRVLQASCN